MCDPITSAALTIGGNYMSQKATAANAQKTMNAQSKAAITGMNFKFQNFEQERIDAFDATLSQLEKLNHSAMSLNSGVKAAINEGMAGRSANLIERQVEGDSARTSFSIKDNFVRKSNEVDLNKENVLNSTRTTIDNINESAPEMPSAFTNFLSSTNTILQGVNANQNEIQNRKNVLPGSTTTANSGGSYSFSGDLLETPAYNPQYTGTTLWIKG